jgi:exonuclease SbcD
MNKLKILHTSDLHLGNPFTDSGFDDNKIFARRMDLINCFLRITEAAVENGVDMLIVSGDFFEEDRVRQTDIHTFCKKFKEISPIQVVLLPGNHDYYKSGGYYDWLEWPANVYIFRSKEFEKFDFPDLKLSVFGSAFTSPEDSSSLLEDFSPKDSLERSILVHHGSLIRSGDVKSQYRPFKENDLKSLKVDYIALGHYHKREIFVDDKSKIKASYPGSPEPLNFGEIYDHSFNIVTFTEDSVEIDFVQSNHRSYLHIDVDCSDLKTEEDVADKCIDLSSGRASAEDIVRFELNGIIDVGLKFDTGIIKERLGNNFFWVCVSDKTIPDYDLEIIGKEETTRGYFVRMMNGLIEGAEKSEKHEKVERLKDALYYGLSALNGRRPEKR